MAVELLMCLTQSGLDLLPKLGREMYLSSQMGIFSHKWDSIWVMFSKAEEMTICRRSNILRFIRVVPGPRGENKIAVFLAEDWVSSHNL